MTDLIKISFVFLLILVLLRKKLPVGMVMLAASVVLFFLYRMSLSSVFSTCINAVLNEVTVKLVFSLSFIRMFEQILREHDILARMMGTVKALFKNRKVVTISMPLLIGLMPSVGGAYFSAPMVAEATHDVTMSPEEKGFINYWFRHPWEYILPLYPGVLLAAAVAKVELHSLISVNVSYALIMVVTGFMFAMHSFRGAVMTRQPFPPRGGWSFVPIFAVLLLVALFHIELHYALLILVLILLFFYRYPLRAVFSTLKHGFSVEVIMLILGVMFFKEAMENSGAVRNLSQFFLNEGIPVTPILFLLPFITGLLTGITVGFVGSTFPLLMSITGSPSISAISFAFAGGFLGVLLSPVHICLVLTREYFNADIWGIYKLMIPGCALLFVAAVVQYLLLR